MKYRHLLTLFAFLSASAAAHAQLAIPSYTIDGGGGTSSGGLFSVTGSVGQPDAGISSGGSFSVAGGFWGGGSGAVSGGFAAWADANLPAGSDKSFGGDANNDGIPNGVHYAFGDTEVKQLGVGQANAPAGPVPADVILRWQFGSDLTGWETIAKWEGGVFSTPIPDDVSVLGGTISHDFRDPGGRGFYRWEATYLGS